MRQSRFLLILILGLLTALGPLATDIYLPAFEEIAKTFGTPISYISLSLSSFFIGLSTGQILYGPLLERFGRKRPLYIGIIIYIIASIGCAAATSANMLIICRFFQAFGACGGLVSSRAIVRDLFHGRDVAKIFSMLMMVLAVSPILAPSIGGIISATYSWRYVFAIITVAGVVILIGTLLILPESKPANPSYSLRLGSVFKDYLYVFKDTYFTIYAIVGSISYAGIYAYISGSPHLYMEMFDVSKAQYSIIFSIVASGLIGATQLSRFLLKRASSERLINVALIFQCIIAAILLTFHFIELESTVLTTTLITCYMGCLGFIFPNASALAMSRLGHTAGNASALLGSIQMLMGAMASAMVSSMQANGSLSMFLVMGFCAVLAQILLGVNLQTLKTETAGS